MAPPRDSARRVVFSLGSNAGDRLATLEAACSRLAEAFGLLRLSQAYETEPVGCPEGSPWYLNACAEAVTDMPPPEALALCRRIEQSLGRVRTGLRNEPRTCDIDIICYGDLAMETPELALPHPRAHLREFVLRPLCDIDPSLVLPGQNLSAAELLAGLPPGGPRVRPFDL